MSLLQQSGTIIRICIGVAYIILGGIILIRNYNFFNLSDTYNKLFSALLISYGIFRLFRAIKLRNEEH